MGNLVVDVIKTKIEKDINIVIKSLGLSVKDITFVYDSDMILKIYIEQDTSIKATL